MNLEKLMALICDELGMDEADLDEDTLLEDIVGDEFELQELADAICQELEIELQTTPELEWSISDLASAISEAY